MYRIQSLSKVISMKQNHTIIDGACHCKNIHYALAWPGDIADIPVRECGCDFCQQHGGSWTSNPQANLNVTIHDESATSRYRFGTGTAEFHVCSNCGVVPFVTSEIDGSLYAVVNVRTFLNIDTEGLERSPANFDGEDTRARLDRRKRKWISSVGITPATY